MDKAHSVEKSKTTVPDPRPGWEHFCSTCVCTVCEYVNQSCIDGCEGDEGVGAAANASTLQMTRLWHIATPPVPASPAAGATPRL